MRQTSAPAKRNVMFKNWTTKDFAHTWGGQEIKFPAGGSLMMDENIAIHFATHLADREINDADAWPKYNSRKLPAYQALVKKAVSDISVEEISNVISDGEADVAEIQRLNANRKTEEQLRKEMSKQNEPNLETPAPKKRFCDQCDSKGVSHKKSCPTRNSVTEFPDLNATAV